MTEQSAAYERAMHGPRNTWTLPFLGEPSVGLRVTLSYGDPFPSRRWGAVWYGSGVSRCRTPWGALLAAYRWHKVPKRPLPSAPTGGAASVASHTLCRVLGHRWIGLATHGAGVVERVETCTRCNDWRTVASAPEGSA